ncbi:hypothetical protein UPYG_G00054930 [Umbra pygmaea]|uniref:Uncharacterized protein n=1 Tax=Umbra pygmaea TaxID=75934 RepID=A0ABD0X810_UMBPY
MATRQASVKKKTASAKERLAKHREKIYSNPVLLEEYRRKERERYRRRREKGQMKTTQDLTSRQHERKKIQWRKYSAKYSRKKKQEQELLHLTPASSLSESENSFANEETNRQEVDTHNENLNRTPAESLDLTRPVEASTPQRTPPVIKKRERASMHVAELTAKLRYAEEKLGAKTTQLLTLNRKIRRLEANRPKAAMQSLPAKISQRVRIREAKKGLPIHSRQKQLGNVVSMFLHRDDVSTVVNGEAGEICRKGQIYRKRALTDTLAKLHRRFLAEHPEQTVSEAQFVRLRPFWIIRPKVEDRETCACTMHENIDLKIKRMKQLGIIETSSPEDLVQSSVCDAGNMSCMYGRCQKCIEKTFPTSLDPLTQGNTVIWPEWITRSVTVTKTLKDGSTEERQTNNFRVSETKPSLSELKLPESSESYQGMQTLRVVKQEDCEPLQTVPTALTTCLSSVRIKAEDVESGFSVKAEEEKDIGSPVHSRDTSSPQSDITSHSSDYDRSPISRHNLVRSYSSGGQPYKNSWSEEDDDGNIDGAEVFWTV